MSEPLLEMTPEELLWCRKVGEDIEKFRVLLPSGAERLFDILLRVEAGRQMAVHNFVHFDYQVDCLICHELRTPADWLAEVEREVKGGE